jgi:uridine kinase
MASSPPFKKTKHQAPKAASEVLDVIEPHTIAARYNNIVLGLGDEIPQDATVSAVSFKSPEGARIYKRSLIFLLGAAARKCNINSLVVDAAIGASVLCSLPVCSQETCELLYSTMCVLQSEAHPIVSMTLRKEEVIAHFEAYGGAGHTLQWLHANTEYQIPCHVLDMGDGAGCFIAINHGTLVPNTTMLLPHHFMIEKIHETTNSHFFRLHHAVPVTDASTGDVQFELRKTDEAVLLEGYEQRKVWNARTKLASITQINNTIAQDKAKALVQVSEAHHDKQVVDIANRIAGENIPVLERPRLVLIAGPTSSGKTTFAKRLCVGLETIGARPIVVSVDSYYKGWPDIDSRGVKYVDWEAISSLNLSLLNDHLISLLAGDEVEVPEYDMVTSMPAPQSQWKKTKLEPGGCVIMEGIHCLNPNLTSRVASKDKFCIAISPLSSIIVDDLTLISSTQVRMLRRMVRDFLSRGRSAEGTLRQWSGVARGEVNNIFPNQNNANVLFNSALSYEINVLKVFAEPLLRSIGSDKPEYSEAQRLLKMLHGVVAMPAQLVPPQSLLREFIGGSWYYEHAGWYKSA